MLNLTPKNMKQTSYKKHRGVLGSYLSNSLCTIIKLKLTSK
jgi:hypothetical protein